MSAPGKAGAILPLPSGRYSLLGPGLHRECCVTTGDSGCEAYTAIAWGVGLSHERSDIAGAESLHSGPHREGEEPWPMMYGHEKSDSVIVAGHITRRRRPDTRPPRFRCDPFARDVALDPRRASAPRMAVPHMLPSSEAVQT